MVYVCLNPVQSEVFLAVPSPKSQVKFLTSLKVINDVLVNVASVLIQSFGSLVEKLAPISG